MVPPLKLILHNLMLFETELIMNSPNDKVDFTNEIKHNSPEKLPVDPEGSRDHHSTKGRFQNKIKTKFNLH